MMREGWAMGSIVAVRGKGVKGSGYESEEDCRGAGGTRLRAGAHSRQLCSCGQRAEVPIHGLIR